VYYEEGLPQVLAIKSMVSRFLSVNQMRASRNFRKLDNLEDDLKDDAFTSINYIFIEPKHDTFNDARDGNSQHPMGTVSAGEELIKKVYEIIRNSKIWEQSALIITYDEHGGFYDCMPPADATPPGDDMRNHRKAEYPGKFDFSLMGVRVPTIVVSPWVQAGVDDKTYDHASILRTVEDRFGLKSLTERDTNANGLGHLFSRELPRTASDQAPTELPAPKASKVSAGAEPSSNDETYDEGNLSGNEAGFLRIAVSLEHILSGRKWGVFGQLLDAVRDRVFPRFARTTMVPNLRSRSEVREYVRRMEDRVATLQQQR
jgi:phospholipase C